MPSLRPVPADCSKEFHPKHPPDPLAFLLLASFYRMRPPPSHSLSTPTSHWLPRYSASPVSPPLALLHSALAQAGCPHPLDSLTLQAWLCPFFIRIQLRLPLFQSLLRNPSTGWMAPPLCFSHNWSKAFPWLCGRDSHTLLFSQINLQPIPSLPI